MRRHIFTGIAKDMLVSSHYNYKEAIDGIIFHSQIVLYLITNIHTNTRYYTISNAFNIGYNTSKYSLKYHITLKVSNS